MKITNKIEDATGLELVVEIREGGKSTIGTYTLEDLLETIGMISAREAAAHAEDYTPEDVEIVLLQPNRKQKL